MVRCDFGWSILTVIDALYDVLCFVFGSVWLVTRIVVGIFNCLLVIEETT